MPDIPATRLDIPPEKDVFVIPGEVMTADEIRSMARPLRMPPLRDGEMTDFATGMPGLVPDRLLDDPEWGTTRQAPVIHSGKGKLLHPWDDEPEQHH
jgi:hypothetical protein